MKVAYLMGSLNRGGAETLVLDICRNSSNHNIDILLIHRKKGQLYEDFLKSGVELSEVFPKHLFDILYFFKLRRIVRNNNISILHTHQVIDAWFAYFATFFLSSKVVLSFHGHGMKGTTLSKVLRHLILTMTDLNIFVSASQKKYYENKHQHLNKSLILPNGIDFSKFESSQNGAIKTELGISNTSLFIGTVGNFTSGRDHFTLCKFILLLKNLNIDFNFIFIGCESKSEPEVYNKCFTFCQENGLSKNVFFLGTRSDVPAIISQFDAFTYSTEHDTFGISVVEAMASGIPVFVNDSEVMCEITNGGKWATIYKSKDEYDLLNKFNYFLKNVDAFKTTAQENSFTVKNKYNIEQHISNLNCIYNSLT
jgi:glycosyltransferase involved in cell wall biosynthesis